MFCRRWSSLCRLRSSLATTSLGRKVCLDLLRTLLCTGLCRLIIHLSIIHQVPRIVSHFFARKLRAAWFHSWWHLRLVLTLPVNPLLHLDIHKNPVSQRMATRQLSFAVEQLTEWLFVDVAPVELANHVTVIRYFDHFLYGKEKQPELRALSVSYLPYLLWRPWFSKGWLTRTMPPGW